MSSSSKKESTPTKIGNRKNNSRKAGLPILLIGGGALLLLLTAIFIYYSNQPSTNVPLEVSGPPALKVEQERFDFGDVKVNTPVTATFEISNVGDQPLRFSEVPKVEVVEGC
jgi:hypothetical protein